MLSVVISIFKYIKTCNNARLFSVLYYPKRGRYIRIVIKLREALAEMNKTVASGKAKPFGIVFCTADLNRNTGGEIIKYDKAILSRLKYSRGKTTSVFHHTPGTSKGKTARKYSTVNICCVGSSEITKVHIDLILWLNDNEVV